MDCQELVNLLSVHLPHDPASRRAELSAAFGPSAPVLNQIDFNGPSSNFAARLVDSLFRRDKELLVKLVKYVGSQIGDDQRQKLWRALARCLGASGNQIHVLTSTKGGVGKTLLSLSTFFAYVKYLERKVVCFDANSMNPDLSRILQLHASGNRPSLVANHLREGQLHGSFVVVPDNPYNIQDSQSFWQVLEHLYSHYQGLPLIVDTNYHIANIVQSRHAQAFIWVIWTWASLYDSTAVIDAMVTFENQGAKIIHVFNPSALVPPDSDFEIVKAMHRARKELEPYGKASAATDILREIDKALDKAFRRSRDENEVPGLVQFSKVNSSDYIPAGHFSSQFIPLLKSGIQRSSAGEPYTFAGLGDLPTRPWNILPITTYSSSLKGYTERYAVTKPLLEDFERQLEPIVLDVWKMLVEANGI